MLKHRLLSASFKKSLVIFTALAVIFSIYRCTNSPTTNTPEQDIAEGGTLAKKYCTTCHRLPDPGLIDRDSWTKRVLPAMGKQLGVKVYMGQYFCDNNSALTTPEWLKIVAFYNTAPVSLAIPKPEIAPVNDWAIFTLQKPEKVNAAMPAMTTMISFDPANKTLYTADAANKLYKWDASLRSKLVYKFESPVTGIDYINNSNTAIITCIGNMAPVNLS